MFQVSEKMGQIATNLSSISFMYPYLNYDM